MTYKTYDVAIIGGGWAGISAAVFATLNNKKVLLLEASERLGGRARKVIHDDKVFDNGQHLLVGAYDTFFELLHHLKLPKETLFHSTPFFYHLLDAPHAPKMTLENRFSSAFISLGRYFPDVLKAFWHTLQKTAPYQNESVFEYLTRLKLSKAIIDTFFAPLVLASMTTRIDKADAICFIHMIKKLKIKGGLNFYVPKTDLSAVLPIPAMQWLQARGATIQLGTRVLNISKDKIFSIACKNTEYTAKEVIVATHVTQWENILGSFAALQPILQNAKAFQFQAITTLYLEYAEKLHVPAPFVGFLNGPIDWVFKNPGGEHANKVACVISDPIPNSQANLPITAMSYLHKNLGFPQQATHHFVITEKRAAFACTPQHRPLRPNTQTSVPGLHLAGDLIQTHLPATLESAVLSGKWAAERCLP